jgi:hypothetical protein
MLATIHIRIEAEIWDSGIVPISSPTIAWKICDMRRINPYPGH